MIKRYSATHCCIDGCKNKYSNTNESIKFYRFPNRPHERERRQVWLRNVRRSKFKTIDGFDWVPKYYARICSQHFLDNKKSDNPADESYNPTIFPKDGILKEVVPNHKILKVPKRLILLSTKQKETAIATFERPITGSETRPIKISPTTELIENNAQLFKNVTASRIKLNNLELLPKNYQPLKFQPIKIRLSKELIAKSMNCNKKNNEFGKFRKTYPLRITLSKELIAKIAKPLDKKDLLNSCKPIVVNSDLKSVTKVSKNDDKLKLTPITKLCNKEVTIPAAITAGQLYAKITTKNAATNQSSNNNNTLPGQLFVKLISKVVPKTSTILVKLNPRSVDSNTIENINAASNKFVSNDEEPNIWLSDLKKMDVEQSYYAKKYISDVIEKGLMGNLNDEGIVLNNFTSHYKNDLKFEV